jgi:hypothetical protein
MSEQFLPSVCAQCQRPCPEFVCRHFETSYVVCSRQCSARIHRALSNEECHTQQSIGPKIRKSGTIVTRQRARERAGEKRFSYLDWLLSYPCKGPAFSLQREKSFQYYVERLGFSTNIPHQEKGNQANVLVTRLFRLHPPPGRNVPSFLGLSALTLARSGGRPPLFGPAGAPAIAAASSSTSITGSEQYSPERIYLSTTQEEAKNLLRHYKVNQTQDGVYGFVIGIEYESHANAVVVDYKRRAVAYFEPNGTKEELMFSGDREQEARAVFDWLRPVLPDDFKFVYPIDYQQEASWQNLKVDATDQEREYGLCILYSILFIVAATATSNDVSWGDLESHVSSYLINTDAIWTMSSIFCFIDRSGTLAQDRPALRSQYTELGSEVKKSAYICNACGENLGSVLPNFCPNCGKQQQQQQQSQET